MKIRLATPDNAAAIAALHTSSWRLTYKSALNEEYLEKKALAERSDVWLQRFSSPKATQCILVVEEYDRIIGFACAFAAEHALIETDKFLADKPIKVGQEPVREEELESYWIYVNAQSEIPIDFKKSRK